MVFGFENLDVWKKSLNYASFVISLSETMNSPRKHLRLIDQLEASSASVAMNIAEGKGRYSEKEFIHFLYIARGSLYESITLLNLFKSLQWIDEESFVKSSDQATEIAKKLNALINSLKK